MHLCYIIVLSLLIEYQASAFPSHTDNSRNFTVDVTFSNNSDCCNSASTCKFHSLYNALKCVKSNTIVTILSSKVILTSPVIVIPCEDVKIVGQPYATVSCEEKSYVQFRGSHDIVIQNITWENCGLNNSLYIGQLSCYDCSNITITNSIFQNSSSAGVILVGIHGNIIIQGSIFKFNAGNGQVGGMLVSTDTGNIHTCFHLVINTTNFYSNDAFCSDFKCSGGLYVDIPSDSVKEAYLHIENSNFSSHSVNGCGAVFIAASITGELTITINDVLFSNNFGKLTGALYLDIEASSSNVSSCVNISFTSTKFIHNGGVIVYGIVNRCMQMSISNVMFSNNIPDGSVFEASNIILELEEDHTTHLDVSDSIFIGNIINVFTISTCHTVIARFSNVRMVNNIGQGGITVTNGHMCNKADDVFTVGGAHRIAFTDSDFINNSEPLGIVYIDVVAESINITGCSFTNNYAHDGGVVVIYNMQDISVQDSHFASNHPSSLYVLNVVAESINIGGCSFTNNYAHDGVVVIYNMQDISVQDSHFTSNHASGLYVLNGHITLVGHIAFTKNTANNGGGISLMNESFIGLEDNTHLDFVGNFAVHYGGAIYAEVPYCDIVIMNGSESFISFVNNSAFFAGDSVYFRILSSCESSYFISSLHHLQCGKVSTTNNFSCQKYMRSSPMNLISNDTRSCNSNVGCFFDIGVMLGEEITLPLRVIDYFNQTAEPTVFLVSCSTDGYELESSSSKFTIISNGFRGVSILGNDSGKSVRNITIDLSTVEVSDAKPIALRLNVSLKGCHAGFVYNKNSSTCTCFAKYGIVQCINNIHSMITRGYWFGYVKIQDKEVPTLSMCPNSYCKFTKCNSDKSNLCILHSNLQQQCHAHRTGVACSECKSSYTLSYDSAVCINSKQCTAGLTALVVILTMIYWIIIVVVVFVVLSFKLRVNYLFAIIYFYSIVDLLIGNNLYISDGVFQTVTLLSSFAKLSPQFLGKLCLVKGMSGIDQLFIHYIHPLAILLILIVITVVARNSLRVSSFISPIIIRAICLLLLLSYTSIACTSLSLLRHLEFIDIDAIYTYSSPEIKFFHGRHILYGGVAVLCELIIGIGLPLLLILDPYLSHKINLIKIRPLLDQFQGGYKDKYRWCSAYYLVCRQIIFLLVYLTTLSNYEQMNFILLVVCAVIAMFHAWIQPYAKESLNSLDEVILVSLVVIVGLNGAAFSSEVLAKMIIGFVFFPLFCFIGFLILYSSIKGRIVHTFLYVKHVLCCGAIQQSSIRNIQDNGALDNYDQYDRSTGSDDESRPLLPSSSSGSVLR